MNWTTEEDHLLLYCRCIGMTFQSCSDVISREGSLRTRGACISRELKLVCKGMKYDPKTMER